MKKLKIFDNNNKVTTVENTYQFLNSDIQRFETAEDETLTIIDIFNEDCEYQKELVVQKNGTLNYIKIGSKNIHTNTKYINSIDENGTLNITFIEQGSSISSIETVLDNKSSTFTINGLIDLEANSKVDYNIQTNHLVESTSDISFKNLLDGNSFAKINIFSIVDKGAAFSKAFQNSKTILLSDDSAIAVTPHLEISIDELEASHGATCGDLDKDSLYYLQSRGLSKADAKQMLLNAIRNDVYEKLENEELVTYVKGLL